jgi:hypothetical protein
MVTVEHQDSSGLGGPGGHEPQDGSARQDQPSHGPDARLAPPTRRRLQPLLQIRNVHLPLLNTVRYAFVAVLLAFFALAGAGCGGEDVHTLIEKTFSGHNDTQVKSGRLSLGLSIKAQGSPALTQPVDLKLSGPFQSLGQGKFPSFDFALDLNASGQRLNAGAVSTSSAGYLKLQGNAYELPAQAFSALQQAYKQAQAKSQSGGEKTNPSLASLGVDPQKWLVDAKKEGDEDVAGTDTVHVSAKIDVPKLVADVNTVLQRARSRGLDQSGQLPPSITPAQQKQISDAIRGATFDFWTGKDDKVLRRLVINLDFSVPEPERAQAQGVTGGQVAFTLQLAELNKQQKIAAPANPRPFSELGSALGGLGLGGVLGGGAPGASAGGGPPSPGGAPGGGPPSSDASQAYLQCLQQAGGDVAKAQECARLLGR